MPMQERYSMPGTKYNPPENWNELVKQIQDVVKTLYIGNGQKAILPRMEGIETLLKFAANNTEKTAKNLEASNAHYEERFDRQDANYEKMMEAIQSLTHSVEAHHKSLHLKDVIGSAKAWTIGFIAFSLFHAGAEYIQANGGSWLTIVLKFIGVK